MKSERSLSASDLRSSNADIKTIEISLARIRHERKKTDSLFTERRLRATMSELASSNADLESIKTSLIGVRNRTKDC